MKFISIRIKQKKINQLNHDTRKQNINYLRNNNNNIYFDNEFNKWEFNNLNKDIKNIYIEKIEKDLNYFKNKMIEEDKKFIENHNNNLKSGEKKRRSSIQKTTKFINSGLITFSNTINKDYENNEKDFIRRLKDFKEEFEKLHNTNIINLSIHRDEKSYHIHFDFLNFDFKKNKTLLKNIGKEGISNLQDLGGKHFKDFGKGYHRGISSNITKSKNLTVSQSHSIEQFKNNINTLLNQSTMDLKDLNTLRDTLRHQTKETPHKTTKDKNKIILKELTKEINLNKKIIKTIEKKISIILKDNINLFSVNYEKISEEINKLMNISKDLNLINKMEQLQRINEILQEENNLLNKENQSNTIETLNKEIERKKNYIKILSKDNRDFEIKIFEMNKEIYLLKEEINKYTKNKEIKKEEKTEIKKYTKNKGMGI